MARIELNIVALGDFTSVNNQIKALQAQVDLLAKSTAGVGVGGALAKELNAASAAFKQTMLSTGQFNVQQVALRTETERFGQALSDGKLKLTDYYNIIKQKSSEAVTQFKALAVEQTKLQNSLIISDPTKQGLLSVYTPTQIDKVAKATQIATNEANLYALAVKKGSDQLINWGKNTQWAGRQLTVGMSVPLMLFGQQAVASFRDVNIELTRLQRLYGEGLTPPSQDEIKRISGQVLQLGKDIASSMGIAQTETVKAAANFAAMGRQGQNLLDTTRQTMRLSKLGAVDTASATNTIVSLQNVYKLSSYQLADAVNFLSDIQKQTTMTLGDMTEAIPRVGPIMQQLGGTYKDTAVMLVAMREAGIPAAQAANAVKSAVASMIAPTSAATKEWEKYGISLTAIKSSTQGNPVQMIEQLQAGLKGLAPLVQQQLIEKLFGKFQFARISALLANFNQVGSQTQNALKIAGANSGELANLANQEMKQATESTTAKWQRAVEGIKASLYPVGQKIMDIATKLLNFGNAVGKIFSGLPGPLKTVFGAIALGVALSGPIIMLTGLLGNFVGYLIKGIFNLKQLATGGKTLGKMLTPELIAAQNATQLFSDGILGDVKAVDLLSQSIKDLTVSIEGMVSSLNVGTEIKSVIATVGAEATAYKQMRLPGFANGVFNIQGSGPKGVDSIPAMIAPGESVISAETTQQYAPFIRGMISGNLRGYVKGNNPFADVYYSPTTGDKQYSAPSAIQGGASALIGEDYPKLINIIESVIQEFGLLDESLIKNKSKQQVYNQFTQMDLGHLEHEAKEPGKGKAWRARNLAGVTHPENQTIEQFAPGQVLHPYIQQTVDSMLAGVVKTGLSKEKIEEAAKSIALGKQPIDEAGMEVYTRILQTVRQRVKSGQLSIDASPGSVSNALVAEATMTARMFPDEARARGYDTVSKPKLLSAITPKFLSDFKKEKKAYLDELAEASKAAEVEGENFATGYFKGIQRKTREAAAAASGAAKAAVNAVKREQKSASPSKVAEQLGLDFGDGYVEGIAKTEGEAAVAGEKLADSVANGAKTGGAKSGLMGKFGGMFAGGSITKGIGLSMAANVLNSALGPMIKKLPGGDILSSGATMAAQGAIFGVPGAIAGGAIGLAIGGISHLINAEKEHQAVVKATFSASSDVISAFGGTITDQSVKIHTFATTLDMTSASVSKLTENVNAIAKLDPKTSALRQVSDSLKAGSSAKEVIGNVEAFASAQVANGMDPSKVKDLVTAMLTYAGKTQYLSSALKEVGNNTKDVQTATTTWLNKLKQAAGPLDSSITSYNGLNTQQKMLASGMLQVANRMMDSTTPFKSMISMAEGLTSAVGSTTAAFNMLIMAANNAGDTKFASILNQLSGKTSIGTAIIAANLEQENPLKKGETQSQYAQRLVAIQKLEFEKKNKDIQASNNAAMIKYHADVAAAQKASANNDTKALKDAKDKLKAQKDILTTMQRQSAELQKQQQYNLSQADLDNQIRLATASGDFLQANLLRQQKNANAVNYSGTNAQQKQQDIIDKLQAKVDVLQAKQDAKNVKAAAGASVPLPTMTPLMSTSEINSNITLLIAALKDLGLKINGGIQSTGSPTSTNPNGPNKAIVSTGGNTGNIALNQLPKGTKDIAGSIFIGSDGKKYRIDSIVKNVAPGLMPYASVTRLASGGLLSGPGTGTSDSLMAMLSNGEYVTKASSVSKYGVSFMDSINSGSYKPSFKNAGVPTIPSTSGTMGSDTYNINVNVNNGDAAAIAKTIMETIERTKKMTTTNRAVRV